MSVIAVRGQAGSSAVAVQQRQQGAVAVRQARQPAVVSAGMRGTQGAQGIPGPAGGSAVQRTAGEQLSALRIVYEWGGLVRYLDQLDDDHINQVAGITLTAAEQGEQINLQISGPLEDAAWSWQAGPVWLGAAGALTQSPPEAGYLLYLGHAVSPTRIILNIDQPVELAGA